MIAVTTPIVLLLVLLTRTWDPYRWGMYINSVRQTAPISFYGQVVDEQGKPLQGARVHVQVDKHNWVFILGARSTTARRQHHLLTDAQGKFDIRGESGRAVVIEAISLSGYRFKPRVTSGGNWDVGFYFAGGGVGSAGPHRPDPNNPVIFTMVPTRPK